MCFSASASFVAGTALSLAGVATLRMVSRRTEIPLAAVPLLFGLQQLIEGMIWLSFRDGSLVPNAPLTFIYSIFSHVLWPMFVPLAIGLIETVPWRIKALAVIQVAGVGAALYLLYFLIAFPVTSGLLGGHIVYESPHFYILPVLALYLIATCVSSLLSSDPFIRLFGALAFVTFVTAYAIHAATFVSVWCFFAAVLSSIIYFYFTRTRRRPSMSGAANLLPRQARP